MNIKGNLVCQNHLTVSEFSLRGALMRSQNRHNIFIFHLINLVILFLYYFSQRRSTKKSEKIKKLGPTE